MMNHDATVLIISDIGWSRYSRYGPDMFQICSSGVCGTGFVGSCGDSGGAEPDIRWGWATSGHPEWPLQRGIARVIYS